MVPGGLNDPLMTPMTSHPEVTPIVAAHEGGAAYMADGYARASGKLGVAFGIGGPGIFNMVTALAAAKTDRSALLAISGEVPTGLEGRGGFQDASGPALNDIDVVAPVTARSLSVSGPDLLDPQLRSAALTALRDRAPVHLSIPVDIQKADLDAKWTKLPDSAYRPAYLDRDAAEASLAGFGDGSSGFARAVILAGPGVGHSGGAKALIEASERFRIPVATTLGAKGIFPESHPMSLGVFGYGGSRWATEALLDASIEVLIVLGSALSQRDTMDWSQKLLPSQRFVHVDADSSLIGRTWPADLPVVGSPRTYLEMLLELDGDDSKGLEAGIPIREEFLAGIRERGDRAYGFEDTVRDATPMHPARMVSEARNACPPETVLVIDSGAHRAWCAQYWPSYGNEDYLSLANFGPMGGAIGLGIGAKLARPDRPLVIATGDGCMLMHGLELHTAARHGVNVVVLVFDNRSYGNIWYRAHEMGEGPENLTDIAGIDWPGFARAMGGDGVAVERPDEIAPAFERGFASPGPFVISARIDKTYPTPIAPWKEAVAEWEDNH